MDNTISYDIDGWHTISGVRVGLALDPSDMRVYTHYSIGSGVSQQLHDNLHLGIGTVDPKVVPASLLAWCQEHEAELLALADCYRGSELDRWSNLRGTWSEDTDDLCEALRERLQTAQDDNVIESYWEASSWLDGDTHGALNSLIEDGDLDTAAERERDEALGQGIRIDLDACKAELRDLAERERDELASEVEDAMIGDDPEWIGMCLADIDTERLAALRKLLEGE